MYIFWNAWWNSPLMPWCSVIGTKCVFLSLSILVGSYLGLSLFNNLTLSLCWQSQYLGTSCWVSLLKMLWFFLSLRALTMSSSTSSWLILRISALLTSSLMTIVNSALNLLILGVSHLNPIFMASDPTYFVFGLYGVSHDTFL